ncbi:MAG: two-component system, cell cycle sensor histidine kinase and response regulator CckA [Chthoniobacter sp.]|nr:two-component system, cell cycle sensor histidine kinase and response regulator CckA [Chthoniobacter sp.]
MNNILTLFHGYLGLLLEDQKLDKSALNGLARIKAGATEASELMDRTHSLARPSALVWREINLADFVRALKPSFDAGCNRRTKIEVDLPDSVPSVWADATRVKTMIVELVRNALEATSNGGAVRVTLRSEVTPAGNQAAQTAQWVSLSVSDTGPGVPEEFAKKIFVPFFTTKKKKNSTGLGLTVVRAFAEQLGGMLRYTSEPGKTDFQILLPARSEAGC